MQPYPEVAPAESSSASALIPSVSLEALLARREAAVAQLRAIAAAVKAYGEIGSTVWGEEPGPGRFCAAPYKYREAVDQRPSGRGTYLTDAKWLEHSIASVDAALWDYLLDKSGLRSVLDAKARQEWHEEIEQNKTPPLTEENIRATFANLHSHRGEFFERGVIAVFRSLSWDYKTNKPQMFGKRIILRYLMSGYGGPNHSTTDSLDDLARVFHLLDGKPEPDHRTGWNRKLWGLHHGGSRPADVEDDYMRVRVFGNGNGHVTFKRLDLVDELNRILAKHHPDALGANRDEKPGPAPLARAG